MSAKSNSQKLSHEERLELPIFKTFLAHVRQWVSLLGLAPTHRIVVVPCTKKEMHHDLHEAYASTEWYNSDASVIIKFNIEACRGKSDEFLKSVARHELMHLLIAPIDDEIKKVFGDRGQAHNQAIYEAIELTADRLAQYFNNVRGEWATAIITGELKADAYERP